MSFSSNKSFITTASNAVYSSYCTSSYRYGFNGMEKDDEVKGKGNSYDFGARFYDSRLGRWLITDPLTGKQPDQSTYKAMLNNPILFVDPTGETEYYYKGKWIGSDNIENGQISIVRSKELKKIITAKNSMFLTYVNLYKNQTGNTYFNTISTDEVIIDYEILNTANKILDKALKEGQLKEFGTAFNLNNEGVYEMIKEGIIEGPEVEFDINTHGSVDIPHSTEGTTISIHSHRTGFGKLNGINADAKEPSPRDEEQMKSETMGIIVGKTGDISLRNEEFVDYRNKDGVVVFNTRNDKNSILNTSSKDQFSISGNEVKKILKDYNKRKK